MKLSAYAYVVWCPETTKSSGLWCDDECLLTILYVEYLFVYIVVKRDLEMLTSFSVSFGVNIVYDAGDTRAGYIYQQPSSGTTTATKYRRYQVGDAEWKQFGHNGSRALSEVELSQVVTLSMILYTRVENPQIPTKSTLLWLGPTPGPWNIGGRRAFHLLYSGAQATNEEIGHTKQNECVYAHRVREHWQRC